MEPSAFRSFASLLPFFTSVALSWSSWALITWVVVGAALSMMACAREEERRWWGKEGRTPLPTSGCGSWVGPGDTKLESSRRRLLLVGDCSWLFMLRSWGIASSFSAKSDPLSISSSSTSSIFSSFTSSLINFSRPLS